MTTMTLTLFGVPRIERDGQPVYVDTRKAIALIAYLAAQGGYQSRNTLGALLWEDSDEASARGALRRTLSVLNSALGGTGLVIERDAIAFDPTALWCDLTTFTEAIQSCAGHDHPSHEVCPRCLEPLTLAATLYKGDFLQGFSLRDSVEFDLWQFQQTEHLRRLYGLTLEKLVRLHTDAERYNEALAYATTWLALDPLYEVVHRQLMLLYAWSGRRSLALRQYHECVRILEQELSVPPLDETTRLYQQIMENVIQSRVAGIHALANERVAAVVPERAELPLVGREREIEAMETAYRQLSDQRNVIVIEGEAGVGKTRLAETFAACRRAEGAAVVIVRCLESETHIAYAPIIRALREALPTGKLTQLAAHWLGELTRLLPEFYAWHPGVPHQVPDSAAQSRLYEAICQAFATLLSGDHSGVLLVEDLQWADGATLDVTAYWLRRISAAPEMGLLTWRSEEVPRTHRIRLLMTDYARSSGQITIIMPQRLSREDIQVLMNAVYLPDTPDIVERLYGESEGLPLFVREYLALLHNNPTLLQTLEWHMPSGIHELLRSRVAQVSEIARQLLDAAAVIGHSFDLDLVRDSSGRGEEETVDGADELEQRGILKNSTGEVTDYEFYHEKLREVVYQDLSMARKRLLHRRTAKAFLNRIGQTDKLGETAALIAAHFHAGGQDVDSAEFYVRAGYHARRSYANREALNFFEQALALGYPSVVGLYEAMGDLCTILGDYLSAIRCYERGMARADPAPIPLFEQKLGQVYHRLGEWELADSYYRSALAALPDTALTERASLLTDRSLTRYAMEDTDSAAVLAQDALQAAERASSPRGKAQAFNVMGLLARRRKQFDLAATHLTSSLSLIESLNDDGMYIAILNNLGLLHMETHTYDEAQRYFEAALEKCNRIGDLHHEAALHNNLADLFYALNMPRESLYHLKRAVSLFAQVGQQDTQMRAETWKLTEW